VIRIEKYGHQGICLPDYDIALDVNDQVCRHVFISHAHADHVPRDRRISVYATAPTADLMRARGFIGEIHAMPFLQPILIGNARVMLYPAGHILGSAMTYIQTPEGSVLYTGDYRTPPSPATEGFQCPEQVDYFITEATFSLPIYRWQSHEILFNQIRTFAQNALDAHETPIFITYNLGKAQEVMLALAPLGIQVQIHGAGYPLCQIYESHGIELGNYQKYDRKTVSAGALITPASSLETSMITGIKNRRIAYCSGWASLESRRAQMPVDALIPLSDHIDFFELIALCTKLRPRHIFITHTPNPEVVQHYLTLAGLSSSPLELLGDSEDI
jgi:putative mRNA 3-end processing factor